MNMKKILPIILIVVAIGLLAGGGFFVYKKLFAAVPSEQAPQQQAKRRITDPVNTIALEDRPTMEVMPTDIHNIQIAVNDLKKPATNVDYELEYQTGSELEGAVGSFPVNSLPTQTKNILLGSCSAGGACTYHKDVQGGTLLAKFSGGPDSYTLKTEWHYIENPKGDTQFSSTDGKFQIDSKDLADQKVLIIYNSPGFPKSLNGTSVSDPYTINGITALKGKAGLTMRMNDTPSSASIMGWDGTNWKEFPAKVDGKMATADVDLMRLYIVVKK